MALFTFLSVIITLINSVQSQAEKPNIVFVWFDDLGFGDVSYNGGPYPTQLLDTWASNNAIKLNWHYSEPVCSASRSAFLTGRFSWRSGLNTVTTARSDLHFNRSLTLFPERLESRGGYKGYYAGKWHVGYKYEDCLPHRRGFMNGTYGHAGTQYYSRGNRRSFDFFDEDYFCPPNAPVCTKRKNLIGSRMATHDMWTIQYNDDTQQYEEVAIMHNNEEYNEKLYTDGIISFIEQQDDTTPFYIQYNLFTPHSNLAEPPTTINNETVDYSMCEDSSLELQYEKQLFCRQMQYAQLKIEEIINTLKAEKLWKNTIFVITSDNGASPDADNGLAGGQTLPLRGTKYGVNEGGVRTPAMIKGGYIKTILNEMGESFCEYNDMFHISDWYHLFLDAADIGRRKFTDSDHELDLWEHIKCSCNSSCDESQYDKREEFIGSMRICGDPQGADDEKFFYSTFIRQGDWKLVINGSYGVVGGCPPDQNASNLTSYNIYNGGNFSTAGSRWFPIPEQNFFNDIYVPALEKDLLRDEKLYQSQCLEAINGTSRLSRPNKNDQYWAPSIFWLFNISNDKIEACNLAEEYPDKVTELFDVIKARSVDYDGQLDIVPSVGAMYMQLDSWDCDYDTTYLVPWGDQDDSINEACQTDDGDEIVDDRRCTELWNVLVDAVNECDTNYTRRRQLDDNLDDDDEENYAVQLSGTLYTVCLMLSALCYTF